MPDDRPNALILYMFAAVAGGGVFCLAGIPMRLTASLSLITLCF